MEGVLGARGNLGIKLIHPKKMPLEWRLKMLFRNAPGWTQHQLAKAFSKLTGITCLLGDLKGTLIRANGEIVDLGTLGYKMVTTAWCTNLCSALFANDATFCNFDFHDCGTGVGVEAIGDTVLVTPYGGARTDGVPSNPTAVQYREVGTITFAGPFAVIEHGLFGAAAADVLLDRTVFAAVNVVALDSIQFTYTLTATAGG